MPGNGSSNRHSVLLSYKFIGPAVAGSLIMAALCAWAPVPLQLFGLGVLVSVLGGLLLGKLDRKEKDEAQRQVALEKLAAVLTLAPEHELFDQYMAFCRALTKLADNPQYAFFREIALVKLASVTGQVGELAQCAATFSGEEAWLPFYERLLNSADVHECHCAAWVRSKEFVQDQRMEQIMQALFDAARRGVLIECIIILADSLWPKEQSLPAAEVLPWLEAQNDHGLRVRLVRESAVGLQPDLLSDFTVFGDRACGVHELDERGCVRRFVLHFNPAAVRLEKERWQRLSLLTATLRNLLDEPPAPA
jgi:hypothetical protein